MGELRAPQMKEGGLRVENGGWHFTYMGGEKDTDLAERVAQKIKAAAHQEFNNDQILSNIRRNISKKRDIFGRNAEFKVVSIDETFPEYLRQNQDEFRHLILDENEKGFLSRFKFW
jgi:beta-1,4-mannosyl-glycoprotein beta-1,4-N-acetylglucosaminyltransferase